MCYVDFWCVLLISGCNFSYLYWWLNSYMIRFLDTWYCLVMVMVKKAQDAFRELLCIWTVRGFLGQIQHLSSLRFVFKGCMEFTSYLWEFAFILFTLKKSYFHLVCLLLSNMSNYIFLGNNPPIFPISAFQKSKKYHACFWSGSWDLEVDCICLDLLFNVTNICCS